MTPARPAQPARRCGPCMLAPRPCLQLCHHACSPDPSSHPPTLASHARPAHRSPPPAPTPRRDVPGRALRQPAAGGVRAASRRGLPAAGRHPRGLDRGRGGAAAAAAAGQLAGGGGVAVGQPHVGRHQVRLRGRSAEAWAFLAPGMRGARACCELPRRTRHSPCAVLCASSPTPQRVHAGPRPAGLPPAAAARGAERRRGAAAGRAAPAGRVRQVGAAALCAAASPRAARALGYPAGTGAAACLLPAWLAGY